MQKRKLGNSNLEVSPLGLGCMEMSFSYGVPHREEEVVALMHVSEQHIIDAIQAMRTEQSQQHQSALNEVTAQVAERVRVAERERVIDNG